jgi:hypothetical protein
MPTIDDLATTRQEAPAPAGSGGRAAWLTIGVILTVLTIAATTASLWFRVAASATTLTQNQEHTYTGRQPTKIVLNLSSGDITIRRGSAGQVTVHRQLQWTHSKPIIDEHWKGSTLTVKQDCRSGFLDVQCNLNYTLTVPQGVTVMATTASGNIQVADIRGPLQLKSDSGDVGAVNPVGDLTAKTESGNVTVSGARSGLVTAASQSGDVTLGFAVAPDKVSADSAAGNVSVAVPAGGSYQVQASTAAGSSNVSVPNNPSSPRLIHAYTAAGDVTVS